MIKAGKTASVARRITGLPKKIARTYSYSKSETLVLMWARQGVVGSNWGDKLNPVLARLISGKNVVHAHDIFGYERENIYYIIGSSLEHAQRIGGIVWGVGFISKTQGLKQPPKAIHAVRGYLSLKRLLEMGISAPEVVGDPALLMPRFYQPKSTRTRFRLGFIAHCFELDLPIIQDVAHDPGILVIDITGDIFEVIDQVSSCDFIASSSLHGLICAQAYGIPSCWIELSNRPVGDGFKFHDYYSSVGIQVEGPVRIVASTDVKRIFHSATRTTTSVDLDRLLDACPFTPQNLTRY